MRIYILAVSLMCSFISLQPARAEVRGAKPKTIEIKIDAEQVKRDLSAQLEARLRPMLTGYDIESGSFNLKNRLPMHPSSTIYGLSRERGDIYEVSFVDKKQGVVVCVVQPNKDGAGVSIRDCAAESAAVVKSDEAVECVPSTGPNRYGREWKTCPIKRTTDRGVQDPIPGKPREYGYEEAPTKEVEPANGRTEGGGASGG